MSQVSRRYMQWTAIALLAGAIGACEKSDRIPPKGATITVAANPSTIPLGSAPECIGILNVQKCGTAAVVATVASDLGVPLPGQDVRFSATAGKLFTGTVQSPVDAANIPVRTDSLGNATVGLITSATTTVTAKSGAASGTLTINTVTGNLSNLTLNVDTTSTGCSSSDPNVTSCSQTICFVAQALDASSNGVPGVVIVFKLQNNTVSGNTFSGQFLPQSQVPTDSNGEAFAQFTPDSTCTAQCGGSKQCQAQVIATTQGGSFTSSPLSLSIAIP